MVPTFVTETSEVKPQTPGKFAEESTLESQHGESLKTYGSVLPVVSCVVSVWLHILTLGVSHDSLMMDPVSSETCWSEF
jgi:hypothetical protein